MSGYIAELKIKVDSTELQSATKQLKDFAQATTTTGQAEQKVRKARDDSSKATEKAEQRASKAEQDRYDKWFAGAARRDKEENAIQSRRESIMAKNVKDSAQSYARQLKDEERASAAEEKRYQKTLRQLSLRSEAETKANNAIAAAQERAQKDALKRQEAIDKSRTQSTLKRTNDEARAEVQAQRDEDKRYRETLRNLNQRSVAEAKEPKTPKFLNSSEVDKQTKSMQNLLASIDPVTREMQRLDSLEKSLRQNRANIPVEQYQKYQNVIDQTRQKVSKYNDSMGRTSLTAKQLQMAQMGLAPQFTDIVVSLQGGQAPLTVLLQQGGQIKDMFGGLGPAVKGVSSAIAGMVNPYTIAASAVTALAYAWYDGGNQLAKLNSAIIQTGNFTGQTTDQLYSMAKANAQGVGSIRQNIDALAQLTESGKLVPTTYATIADAATTMSEVSGTAVSKIIEDFTSLGDEPVKAAIKLNEKYHFLTDAVYQQAQALVTQGRETEAVSLLTVTLADTIRDRAKDMEESGRGVAKVWRAVSKAFSDAITNSGKALNPTDQSDLENVQLRLETFRRNPRKETYEFNPEYLQLLKNEVELKEKIAAANKKAADASSAQKNEEARFAARSASLKKEQAAWDGVKKAKEELRLFNVSLEKTDLSGDEKKSLQAPYLAAIKKAEEAESKKGPKSAIIDNTDVNDLKNRVSEIKAQYKSMTEGIKDQLEAGKLTSEQAFEKRKSLITQESVETKAAYEEQIAGLEKLKSSKNISANQTISLDRQISDARTKMVVAEEDAQKRLSSTDADENKRLKTKTRNIEAYSASLSQMVENLRVAGERERAGLGQSSGQRELSGKLTSEDDRYNNEVRSLNDQAAENPALAGEVEVKLAKAAKAHTDMKDQIVRNYDDMKTAQMDWAAGVSSAFQQYVEDGQNYASMSNQAFTSAFGSMESALNSFVTTGKASFSDLAKSILADMAKIAIRAAASQALSAMFSAFAPTPTSLGSTAAGYTGEFFKQHAKGGAFAGGTQFFAKGGAFTNSVVSKPTAFTSASGSNNVMGEAGPEAIMPLTRGSDGSLGVRAQVDLSGLQQQGGGVQVNIQIDGQGNSSTASSDSGYSSFGKEIGQFVDQRYRQLISKDLNAGGDIWKVMNGS